MRKNYIFLFFVILFLSNTTEAKNIAFPNTVTSLKTFLDPPVVTGPDEICGSTSVTLSAAPSNNGNIIRWYNVQTGGTPLATGDTYSVLVTASTIFYAEIENNGVFSDRTPHAITMYALPVISNSGPVCVGETLQLSGSGTPAASNPWSSSNTAIATVNSNGVVSGISQGNATITYRNSDGCQITTSITVQARPSANVGTANSVCIDSSVIIGAPAVPNHTYAWTADSGDSGFSSTMPNPSVSPATTTTYTLTETNNATGCSRTNSITVTVRPKPVISDFTFINNVCSGTQIQFAPFVTGGTAPNHYSWDFGDGQTAANASPVHRFNSYGCGTETFNVTLTVTDAFGCVSSPMTKTVTIIQQPDTNFFDPDASDPSLEFNNCQNASTSQPSFSISVENASIGSCILSYDINWGDGSSETNINFPLSHTYANLGVFPMSITAYAANGCNRTRIYNVRNISNPSGGLYSPGSTTNLCAPTAPLQFAITGWYSNSTDTQYQLTYGDGTPPVIITQAEMLASPYFNPVSPSLSQNYPVPHSYTVSNCPGSAFQIHLRISNACGYTDAFIGPINVNTSTLPDFVSPPNACVNTSVLFDNISMVGTGNSCNGLSRYSWNFGDGTPVVNTPFVSGAPDMSHTYAVPGVYTVILTAISYCTSDGGGLTISKTICIENPLPAATYTVDTLTGCAPLAVQAASTTNVSGSCSPIYLWEVIYIPTNCGSTPGASYNYFTNGTSASSADPSFNFPNAGKYRIRLTITNSCGPVITTKDIIVKQPPIISIAPVANLCGADAVTLTPQLTATNCGDNPLTYLWDFPGGTPSSSTDAAPTVIYNTPGSHTFSVQVSNECGTVSDSESFSISPTVIANAGIDVTICQGDSTTLNGTASGGVPGYTYSWSPGTGLSSTSIINPVATPNATTTYALTVRDSQNCPKTDLVTVYVNTVNQGSVGNSQTICSGNDPVAFTSGIASATGTITYQWQISTTGNTTGFTDIPGANDAIYDSPPITQHTWFRRRVISTLNGVVCEKTTNFVEIIINDVNGGTVAGDQDICSGGDPAAFTEVSPASGTGSRTYQWQSSVDNLNWADISLALSISYDPPVLTQTTYYRRRVISNLNGVFCTAFSNVGTITVVPDPIVTVQPLATQTICQGNPVAMLNVEASGGLGAYTYQWFSNTTNSTTGGIPVGGQVNDNFTPVLTNAGTFYYYVVITAAGPGCSVTSTIAQVIVIAAPMISTQPASSAICAGGTPALLNVSYANGTGTPAYQWYSNTVDSTAGGTAIPTATGTSYQPDGNTEGTTYYYAIITFPSGGCNSITSNTATVVVTPAPQVSTQPEPTQDICTGGSIAALTVGYSGGSGTPSYQWFSNTTASNSGGTAIPAATGAAYTPSVFTAIGTYYYYVTITLSAGGCAPITSNVAMVNVVADPVVTVQPLATQILCQNSTPTDLEVTANGGVGTLLYQWYSSNTNSNSGGTLIPGEQSDTFTPPTIIVGTAYYYVMVTTAASGCSVTSAASEVIVIDSPVFTTQPQSETLCFGETPALLNVAFANGTGTASYQWFSNTIDDTAGATAIPGAESTTYQPSGASSGTLYYFATITFSTGGCSVIVSNIVPITIHPLPEITTPQADVVCNNEAFAYAPANGGGNVIPAGTQYTWTAPAGTGFTGGTAQSVPQAGIIQTLTNTTNAAVTATYTVIPVSNGCNGNPFNLTITVNPEPQIPAITMPVCSEGGFTITPATVPGAIVPAGVTYTWDAPVVTGGITGGQPGTGQPFIGGSLVNPTNIPQTATYTVNIVSPPGVCAGDPFTITITVNPTPFVAAMQQQTICSSGTFIINPTDGGGNIIPANTTYTWSAPVISPAGAVTGGSAQAAPQTSIAQALVNTTNDIATATYTVTPNSGDCPGDTFEVVVTVNPVPTVDDITPQTLCNGAATTAIAFTGATAGTTYNWANNTPSIGLATTGQGDIPSFIVSNSAITPVTATITVTPVFDGCPGTPKTFTITVNPAPMVSFSSANQAICSATTSAAVTLTSTTPGASISWTAVQPAGITGVVTSGTNTIPAQTLTNSTSSTKTVIYTAVAATSDATACPGPVATYTIVVNPVPFVDAPIAEAICSGDTVTVLPPDGAPNNIPAGTTFTWAAPTGTGFTGGTAQAVPQPSFSQTLVNTTINPVTATYTVTPAFNGCTGVPFTITVTVNPTAVIADSAQTICTGGSFTSDPADNATLLPAGTVYNWSTPTVTGGVTGGTAGSGETVVSGTLVNPSAGVQTATYIVTPVSPDGNCAGDTFNVVITVSPVFSVASVVSDYNGFEISTAGGTDGSINLTPTGGSGIYTYVWNGPGGFAASTQDISNLGEGTYTVTISDGLCANIFLQFELVAPLPLVIQEVIPSHLNVKCFGENTGVIEVAITTVSVAPFDYAILLPNGTIVENVLNSNAENYVFDNLPAGTYNIRVTDANGTIKNLNGIIITQPAAALTISNSVMSNFNGFSISCNGANNGSIDITVSGGTAAYIYAWSGPAGYAATTQDISTLGPGTYTVIVTDDTGVCTVTQAYTITEPLPLALGSVVSDFNGFQIACFGGNTGSINSTPTGGTSVYSYQWSGPNGFAATTQDVANLVAGTYTLNLTDSNGCALGVQTYVLNQPAALAITETHVNVLCFGANTGSIDVTVTGGVTSVTGNYTFAWTGPNSFLAATEDLTNIEAGIYNLTVTDNSGCTKNIVVTITQQPEIIITPTTTPITCYGANNASISIAITGGDAPYVATWSNLATGTFQDNLAAGTYIITVTDDSGCTKQATVVINEAPIFTVNPVFTHVTCFGANDGTIALNLIGGQAPVTLTWSDGSTAGTTRNNLAPGTYTATIFDGTPCQIVRTFTIVQPVALSIGANVTHATVCDDPQSGAIDLHPAGGTLPYTFVWSNGATTEDLAGLTSGNYAVTVTDANGCSQTKQYAITRQEPMAMTVDQDVQFNCDAHTVIQTNIARASGGVPPFNYTWSAGTVSGGNGQMMTTDVNGTYIVTATDAMGCTTNFTFEVNTQRLGEASFLIDSYANATYSLYSIFDPIQFTNTSTGDFTGVSWSFGDGSVSDEESPEHTYVREGAYLVTQTVTYPYGCVDKKILLITVQKGYDVMIPNGFTPNDDGTNDSFTAVFRGLKSIELSVYDTWGALIYYEKGDVIKGWDGTLNGVPSENGNYVYKITAETFYGDLVKYEGPFVLIK